MSKLQHFLKGHPFLAELQEILIMFPCCPSQEVELFALIQPRRVLAHELGLEDCMAGWIRVESENSTFSSSGERMSWVWS